MPPVRPPAQPYWMGILQQSAQTTQSAFDDINQSLERSRRARFESEQYKAETLTQMRKFENEDRDYRLRERLLGFQIEQAGVDNYHKQVSHDLYLRRQSLDEAKARADLTVNQFLEPLDTEIRQLEGMPGTEQRVQELKAKRQGLVDPILKQITDVPSVSADPEERESLINRNVNRTLEIINRTLSGNENIDNSLFPDSLNNQIGEKYAREEGGSSPMRDLTETDEIREFIKGTEAAQPAVGEVDNRPFDFGPSNNPGEKAPTTKSYPVGSQPRAVPVGINDPNVTFTNPLEMPNQQYGPRVNQEMIDSKLSYIDGLRNKAIENKTYTPAHEKRYSDYLDNELGKTNNPLRAAAAAKIKTALIGDLGAKTKSSMILSAQSILGPSETQRIADEAIIDKQRLGKEAAFEKINQELDLFRKKEEIKKEMEGGVDEISKTRKELDDIRSLLANPESSPNQLAPETISVLRANEEKLAKQLNSLITQKYAEPQAATQPSKENPLIGSSAMGNATKGLDSDPSDMESSFTSDSSAIGYISTKAMKQFGLGEDDVEDFVDMDLSDPSKIKSTLFKSVRSKFEKEWDSLDNDKKALITNSPEFKRASSHGQSLSNSIMTGGLAVGKYQKLSPKEYFVEAKMKAIGFDRTIADIASQAQILKAREEKARVNKILGIPAE